MFRTEGGRGGGIRGWNSRWWDTAFVEQAPMGNCHLQLKFETVRGATRRSCLLRGDMGRENGL